MTRPAAGIVCLRNEVMYFEESRVHLSNDAEYEVTLEDRALLEIVMRGESDFGLLCARLAALSESQTKEDIAKALEPVVQDRRAIIELTPMHEIVTPEVIVCGFSPGPSRLDSRSLVSQLRRSRRVLHLGHEDHVRGTVSQNLSRKASEENRLHSDWFQFIQWCRGTIRRHPGAVLVLCGQQDAILFGDLVPQLRSVVAVESDWPPRTGAGDMLGPGWVPDDPFDALRALFYALRFASWEDMLFASRASSSDLAVLEAFAIRHATCVVHGCLDQHRPLMELGVDPARIHQAHVTRSASSKWKPTESKPRTLVLVTSGEGGVDAILPVLELLNSIPLDQRPYGEVAVRLGTHWLTVKSEPGRFHVVSRPGPMPNASTTLAALVFPGLTRDLKPAWEALAMAPCFLASSAKPHPLLDLLGPNSVLEVLEATALVRQLRRLLDADDGLSSELLNTQRRALREHSMIRHVQALLDLKQDEVRT